MIKEAWNPELVSCIGRLYLRQNNVGLRVDEKFPSMSDEVFNILTTYWQMPEARAQSEKNKRNTRSQGDTC